MRGLLLYAALILAATLALAGIDLFTEHGLFPATVPDIQIQEVPEPAATPEPPQVERIQVELVFLTPNGKTFHRSPDCMALTRSKQIYAADRPLAEGHGLKPCGICYRKKPRKVPANGWAAPKEHV